MSWLTRLLGIKERAVYLQVHDTKKVAPAKRKSKTPKTRSDRTERDARIVAAFLSTRASKSKAYRSVRRARVLDVIAREHGITPNHVRVILHSKGVWNGKTKRPPVAQVDAGAQRRDGGKVQAASLRF